MGKNIMTVFQSYGKYYDILYADKDYEKECDFLENVFEKYSLSSSKTILDAGCGTGGHAIILAKRGFNVTGIDVSETMIDVAKGKASENGVNADFYVMDLRNLNVNKRFDACICMFAVLNYITETKEILKVLSNIRKHLKKNALFIFDFWYGPAVLTILPSFRVKRMGKGDIRVIRFAEPHLDTLRHICETQYQLIASKGNLIIDEVHEKHVVRFFFPEEIKHYLKESGFELLRLCSFLDLNADPSETNWNAAAVSRAI